MTLPAGLARILPMLATLVLLVAAIGIRRATEPGMRLMRRIIPPLRLGGVSLDMGFLVLLLVLSLLNSVVMGLLGSALSRV